MVHFVLTIQFILTFASDRALLYGNKAFSILVLSTKKQHSSFLKKGFVFKKICFKVKVLKSFKIFTYFLKKHVNLLNSGLFWNSLGFFFRRIYALSVGFKMKKHFPKTNPNFAVKLAERSNHSFLPSILWVTFFNFQTSELFYVTIECVKLNWLCKRMKKVRSSQADVLVLSWVIRS